MGSDPRGRHAYSLAPMASGAASAFQLSALIALLIAVTGCGGGDELNRVEVQGDVTVNGVPVKAGRVNFIPDQGTRGPASGSGIIDGKFVIPRDRGPVPGKYVARVQIDDLGEAADSGAAPVEFRPPTKEEVLAGKDELRPEEFRPNPGEPGFDSGASVQDTAPDFHVTVTAEGPNKFVLAVGGEDAK